MQLKPLSPRTQTILMWSVAGFILILKLLFLFGTSVRNLATTQWIIDDAFIEMRVARNIALGLGFSFDGIHPTTGSPFLWTYLIALPHLIAGKEMAIRLSLTVATLLGTLASVVVYALAKKVTGKSTVAWTAFLLCLLSIPAVTNSMNGLDTSLFTFLVVAAVACALDVGRSPRIPAWLWGCITGLLLGLAMMTRGDGIFLALPLGLLPLIALARSRDAATRREQTTYLAGLVIVSACCLALYVAWQYVRTGSPVPANQVGRREIALALHDVSFSAFSLPNYIRIVIWNVFQLETLLRISIGSTLLGFLALLLGLAKKELRPLSLITLLYGLSFFAVLILYQWYFPDFHGLRYLNPVAHLVFILIAAMLWDIPANKGRAGIVVIMTVSILILSAYLHYQLASRAAWGKNQSYIGRPTAVQLDAQWHTIDWMREHLPEGTVVGVRDHGRVAMFTDLPIQDLAGNIDPRVPFAVKDGTLRTYLKARNVEYLLLPDPSVRGDLLYRTIFRDFVLQRVKDLPATDEIGLYKIDWRKTLAGMQ